MLTRTQRSTLVFERPFKLATEARLQPAGTYLVETEEELVEGLSFPAYRRIALTITLQSAAPGCGGAGAERRPGRPREGAGR